jgi:hypothetical protein
MAQHGPLFANGIKRRSAGGDGSLRSYLGLGQPYQARVGGFPSLFVFA